MVVNVEKLLKMVKNGDFSKFVKKNGEMLKNVGETLKKICNDFFTLSILKIQYLTQSFTNIFCHLYSLILIDNILLFYNFHSSLPPPV